MEPKVPLSWSWHYEYICEWLELVASGEFKRRWPEKEGLIINVPPRTAKSLFITVTFPVWTWLKNPERRFLCASYSGKLAIDHHSKRRDLINSEFFQKKFGHKFLITKDQADDFRNNKTGYFIATSVGGSGTGFGGDICIGDDLLSATDAMSKAIRKTTNDWLDGTFSTRLNSRVTGCFVHVSQRLADDDPTGYLLEKYKDRYVHIKIKREATEDERYEFPKSGRVYLRAKGDVLDPERCPPIVLDGLKRKSREWAGQEQQEPAPAGGSIVKADWWKFYGYREPLPSFDLVILSVDCAFKSKEENDYVAITKWGCVGPRFYLLERQTEHLGYVATKAAIRAHCSHGLDCIWCQGRRPDVILVEDKANGSAVIDELRREAIGRAHDGTPIFIPIIPIEPEGGKESRFYACSVEFEAGNVYACQDMPGWPEYFRNMCNFAGEGSIPHDDDCDSTSQAIIWRSKRVLGLADWGKRIEQKLQSEKKQVLRALGEGEEITASHRDGRVIKLQNGKWTTITPEGRTIEWDGRFWFYSDTGLRAD